MAQEPIDIVVSEKGVAAAAENVVRLADASDRAETSIGKLKAALAEIKGTSVQALRGAMEDAKGGTEELRASTGALSTSQKEVAASSQTVTKALNTEAAAARALKAEKKLLQDAEAAASRDRRLYAAEMLAQARSEAIAQEQLANASRLEVEAQAAVAAQMDSMFARREREITQQRQLAQARELALAVHDAGIENARIDAETAATQKLIQAQQAEAESLAAIEEQYAALAEYRSVTLEGLDAEAGEIDIVSAAYRQLAEATNELNATKQLQRDISNAVRDGYLTEEEAVNANTGVLQQQIEATQQVTLAKQNLAETIEYVNATTEVNIKTEVQAAQAEVTHKEAVQGLINSLGLYTAEQKAANIATAQGVSETVAASAALGLLEGRTLSVNRAAAQYLTKILQLGPAFTAAFSYVLGPIVLISVLFMVGEAVNKVLTEVRELPNTITESFQKSTDQVRTSVLAINTEADKLQAQLDKIEGQPQRNGGVLALDAMNDAANRLSITLDKDITKLDELVKKNSVGFWAKLLGDRGTEDVDKVANDLQAKLKEVRNEYDQTIENGNANTPGGLTKANVAQIRESEMNALVRVYGDATKKLDPLVSKLREQMLDFQDPTRKALGVAGPDPSAALAKAVGIKNQMLADQNQIGAEYRKDNLGMEVNDAKRDKAAQADEGKAARLQWNAAMEAFKQYDDKIKASGVNPTAQQNLDYWKKELGNLTGSFAGVTNQQRGNDQIGKYQGEVNNQTFPAEQLKKLMDRNAAMSQYGEQLRETTLVDKILQEAEQKHITILPEMVAMYRLLEKSIQDQVPMQKALNEVYKQATSAVREHSLYQAAGLQVAKDYPQYAAKIGELLAKENEEYLNATDHLRQYNKGIADQTALLGLYGNDLEIATKLQALQNQQTAAGHALSQEQIADERERLETLQHGIDLDKAKNDIYYQQITALQKLKIEREALDQLSAAGKLNTDQYKFAAVQNEAAQTQNGNDRGQGKASDFLTNAMASYVKIKSIADGVQSAIKETFNQLADGAADALGRAIVMGQNLGATLKDVARTALAGLLSALIKIGIQLAIVEVLSKVFHINMDKGNSSATDTAKTTALAIAGIAAVTAAQLVAMSLLEEPAWSLAEAVSLFSYGANALAAQAGIAAVVAQGDSAKHFALGGMVYGSAGRGDTIPAYLTAGEYVLNTGTVDRLGGKSVLDQVQRGTAMVAANTPSLGKATVGSKNGYSLVIEDHTNGVKWQKVPIGEDQMRLIAQDESQRAVSDRTDGIVAGHLNNGNSKTSKALKANTNARRTG